jgi:predicted DNA-binding protein with PD1-like motif
VVRGEDAVRRYVQRALRARMTENRLTQKFRQSLLSSLQQFVQRENIHAATFTAIGALSDAVLLYFQLGEERV